MSSLLHGKMCSAGLMPSLSQDKAPTAPSAAPELDLDLDLDLNVVAPPAASPTTTSAPAPAPAAAAAAAPSPAHPYSSDEQPGSPFTDFLPLGETVNTLAPDASIIDDIVPAGSDEATKPPASGIESESAEVSLHLPEEARTVHQAWNKGRESLARSLHRPHTLSHVPSRSALALASLLLARPRIPPLLPSPCSLPRKTRGPLE